MKPLNIVKSLKEIEDYQSNGTKSLNKDGVCYFDLYPDIYWSVPTKEEYEKIEEKIRSAEISGNRWNMYAWHDVSGFDYWMIKEREPNYVQITIEFTSQHIDEDEIPKIDKAFADLHGKFIKYESMYNFPEED